MFTYFDTKGGWKDKKKNKTKQNKTKNKNKNKTKQNKTKQKQKQVWSLKCKIVSKKYFKTKITFQGGQIREIYLKSN